MGTGVKSHMRAASELALFGEIDPQDYRKTLLDHIVKGKLISTPDTVNNLGWVRNLYEDPSLPSRYLEDDVFQPYEGKIMPLLKRAIAMQGTTYWQATPAEYAGLLHHMWGVFLRHKELFNAKRPRSGEQVTAAHSKEMGIEFQTIHDLVKQHFDADPLTESMAPLARVSIGITSVDVPVCLDVPFYYYPADWNDPYNGEIGGIMLPIARHRILMAHFLTAEEKAQRASGVRPAHITRIKLFDFKGVEQKILYDLMVAFALEGDHTAHEWVVNRGSGAEILASIQRVKALRAPAN